MGDAFYFGGARVSLDRLHTADSLNKRRFGGRGLLREYQAPGSDFWILCQFRLDRWSRSESGPKAGHPGARVKEIGESTGTPLHELCKGLSLQSKSGSAGNATAMGGGREGRPRQPRILRIASGGWIAHRMRIRPKQLGHSSTSMEKDQFSYCISRSGTDTVRLMG